MKHEPLKHLSSKPAKDGTVTLGKFKSIDALLKALERRPDIASLIADCGRIRLVVKSG